MASNPGSEAEEESSIRPRISYRSPWEVRADARYLNDSTFRQTVDMMRAFLAQYHLTPTNSGHDAGLLGSVSFNPKRDA